MKLRLSKHAENFFGIFFLDILDAIENPFFCVDRKNGYLTQKKNSTKKSGFFWKCLDGCSLIF